MQLGFTTLCVLCCIIHPEDYNWSHTWSAEVWDKDFVRTAQGSDDFLGRLRLPMVDLLRNREAELSQRLEDSTCSSKACLVLGVWFDVDDEVDNSHADHFYYDYFCYSMQL